jgi:RimJ/RimL family protein N-acetyltransferase
MSADSWAFETARLRVGEWSQLAAELGLDRAALTEHLTDEVTWALPDSWRGPFSKERAAQWVVDRDAEGLTLLVVDRESRELRGFFVAYQQPDALRIGYVLVQAAWGQGLATELLAGVLYRCRERGERRPFLAGVTSDNRASRRVLEKCGFELVDDTGDLLEYRME